MMLRTLLLPAAVVCLAAQTAALAHRLDSEFERTPDGYRIEFFLGDGSPGVDLEVTAQAEGGEPIAIGRTDEKGQIRFVPPSAGKWTIVGKGGGHSTARNPLVIDASGVTTPAASRTTETAVPASQASAPNTQASRRGRFPWLETAISFGFIAILTLATLAMMRRSARFASRPGEVDQLTHEIEHLQATIRQLRREVAELKGEREHRA